jgi:hypothetical protein
MAVENKYVDSSFVAGKKAPAYTVGSGGDSFSLVATFEVAVADDDGSIYRIFPNVPANAILTELSIACDAITNGTDWDAGLYKTNSGAVITKDVFMNGQTLASALTRATGHQLGLGALNVDAVKSTLATLSGQTNPDEAYDIALTANTVGSAAGTVSVFASFVYA